MTTSFSALMAALMHSFLLIRDVRKACDACISAVVNSDALISDKIHYYLLYRPTNLCPHHWLTALLPQYITTHSPLPNTTSPRLQMVSLA